MNALFVTQALGLRFHYQLRQQLMEPLALGQVGFYVCESMFFRNFVKEVPDFSQQAQRVLKEWDLVREAKSSTLDLSYLTRREQELNAGPLWNALICDRRIILGRWSKERQDYVPRFSHHEMLRILQVALQKIDAMFKDVRPEVVFSFVPVTFGEYLFSMIARSLGIPTLFLYPTKIKNVMAWMSSYFGRPDHIVNAYHHYEQHAQRDLWIEEAEQYLHTTQGMAVRHEGMIPIPGTLTPSEPSRSIFSRVKNLVLAEKEYWLTESREDNHINDPAQTFFYRDMLGPMKAKLVFRRLRPFLQDVSVREKHEYAFFPLQAEPEVSLMIQGKSYVNQIELIRNIARNLPVGMKLIVKEHPRCIGYRPWGYYRKILDIPNVLMADPYSESQGWIASAKVVLTIWSFVGFEAIISRRPVIVFGTPVFGILPTSMIRRVTELDELNYEVRDLLAQYQYDERALIHFIAANLRGGIKMDFYSKFLKKKGRYLGGESEKPDDQFGLFVEYTVARVREVCQTPIEVCS